MIEANVERYRALSEAFNDPAGAPDALLAPEFRIENIVTAVTDRTF